jgi:hypothetical protein
MMHAVRARVARFVPEPNGPRVSSLMRAAGLLRESGMPSDEIMTVVTTAEPRLARRYLELHLERLEEWLVAQRHNLASVELLLRPEARSPGDPQRIAS